MAEVPEFSDVDVVFPTKTCLPPASDIPAEFDRMSHPLQKVAADLFFKGGRLSDYGLKVREGVDGTKAARAIQVCLGSFEPKHEHKMAGVAYLLDQWFEQTTEAR